MTQPPRSEPEPFLDARLDADRNRASAVDGADLQALWAQVASETVDRPRTWRDQLAELPTSSRLGVAAAWAVAWTAIYLGLGGIRPDLFTTLLPGQVASVIGASAAFLAAGILALFLVLRPVWRPGVATWVWGTVLLGLPVLAAVLPIGWPGHADPVPPMVHLHCGGSSSGLAVFVALGLGLLDRGEPGGVSRALLRGGLAGVLAFGLGFWNCPGVHWTHLLLGHALHGVVAAGVGVALVGWLRGRRSAMRQG
jgi:hypothetical protein